MKNIFLVCLIMQSNVVSMEHNTYSKGIEIPGALRPSQDSHSPVASSNLEIPSSLYLERLANHYAQKITTAGVEHYHTAIERGFKPGSIELNTQLLEDNKQIKKQLAANEQQKKTESAEQEEERKVHELSLSINACALHVAAVINAGIAFQNKTNRP